jgi:hypothetical protein
MLKYVFITTLSLSLAACQKSNSGSSSPAVDPAAAFQKQIETCRSQSRPYSAEGKWLIREVSKDGIESTNILEISNENLSYSISVSKEGTLCEVKGSSSAILDSVSFKVFNTILDNNFTDSADGKNRLNCSINLPAGRYTYTFNGGCLLVETSQGTAEFAPYLRNSSTANSPAAPAQPKPLPSAPTPTPVPNPIPAPTPVPAPSLPPEPVQPIQPQPVPEVPNNQPIPVQPVPVIPPPPVASALDPEIIKECGASFYASSDKMNCIKFAKSTDMIQACSKIYYSSTDKLNCIKNNRPIDIMNACSQAFYGTADKQTCIEKAPSVAIVEACSAQFYSSKDKLNCIQQ